MANNNLINAAKKIADALNAIALSDKTKEGKSAKLEQEKLLSLIGDKKRLDNIDKQERDAKKEYDRIVTSGKEEASRIVRLANDGLAERTNFLNKKDAELTGVVSDFRVQREDIQKKTLEMNNDMSALKTHRDATKEREIGLNRREAAIAIRETKATARETEMKRFDDWRKAAPV